MQDPRTGSTLELVVNEAQLQNLSQIDLSRPSDTHDLANSTRTIGGQENSEPALGFNQIQKWPGRVQASLKAKFDEAKAKSETKTELVFRLMQAFSGVVVWFLCFIFTILMPILLLGIGLFNIENCPGKASLPYLVFALGFLMTASNLFNLAFALDLPILTNHQILSHDVKNTIASIVNIIINCVVGFLYILTAYMVSNVPFLKQDDGTTIEDGTVESPKMINCNSLLYYFTFWFVVSTVSLIGLLCLVAGSLFLYNQYRLAIIRGSTPRSKTANMDSSTQANAYATNRV